MSDLQQHIENLSPEKQALLYRLLKERKNGQLQQAPIMPREKASTSLPLSFNQEGFWLLSQIQTQGGASHVFDTLRMQGTLDRETLHAAIGLLIARHEILRTTFSLQGEQPVQVVTSSNTYTYTFVDFSHRAGQQEEAISGFLAEQVEKEFDLVHGPVVRIALIQCQAEEHILLIVIPHICTDGWSMHILKRELAALYNGILRGHTGTLSPLPVQYADYTLWQRKRTQSEEWKETLSYWKRTLANAPTVLHLPGDHPRPQFQTFHAASQQFHLSPALTSQLEAIARQEGVTPFMFFLAAFQVLLFRYTQQEDFLLGTPVANRTQAETENLIGLFMNLLIVRARLAGRSTFRTLLRHVHEEALEMYTHQEIPFECILEALEVKRDPARHPLVQVSFTLEDPSSEPLQFDGLTTGSLDPTEVSTQFDLTFVLRPDPAGIALFIDYNTDLFHENTISRMAGHFQTLLTGIALKPDLPISDLPLLTEAEQQQLRVYHVPPSEPLAEHSLPRLFEAQAEQRAGNIAIAWEKQQTLSYAGLNRQANQLAHHLRMMGVCPGDRVGIYLERSPELVMSMLAILKVGAAYVPLDLAYPSERIAFMIQDTQMSALITNDRVLALLPPHRVQKICLDRDRVAISTQSQENLAVDLPPNALAYIIYTSGSTGIPKGVAVPHQAITRLVLRTDYIQLTARDRVAQVSNASFDAATFEIWGALLNGAQLVGIPREVTLQPATYAAYLQQERISVLFVTTALFNQMAQEVPDAFQHLETLLFGGEAVSCRWVRAVLNGKQPSRLLHVYGPTENTTFSTWHLVKMLPEEANTVPIGSPIANTQVYVLDQHMQPVPAGVPGELYLGGAGLARGYFRRPAITAESFVPDPFSTEEGRRLYKTGDLVRYRPDGAIEFLDRLDGQVKIRGFRVELGEIETLLQQYPAIKEAVVVVWEDTSENKRLVAYVVPEPFQAVNRSQLRRYLQTRLAAYMLPSAIITLERLPLNPNGKVDKKGLPTPELSQQSETKEYLPPRNHIEELLAGIWATLLGLDAVDIYDNFFEIGGHSLLATQVISHVRSILHVNLPLSTLFERPVLADFAREIEKARQDGIGEPLLALSAYTDEEPAPLSFAQQRLWFLNRLQPESPFYNLPLFLRLDGPLQWSLLEQSLQAIIQRHESLRTSIVLQGEQAIQIVRPPSGLFLPLLDLSGCPPEEQQRESQRLVCAEAARPFDLTRGPVFRMHLMRLNARQHVLLMVVHHISFDGWSVGVFLRELAAHYTAARDGKQAALAPLTLQYADYARWQRDWLQGRALQTQLAYWKDLLANAPAISTFPLDHPRPIIQTYRGAVIPFAIPPYLTQNLKQLSQQHQVTLYMTLLSAFGVLLRRHNGQEDLVIGSPIANRQYEEIEALIGFFVNTLALRLDLTGSPSFLELIQRTREMLLGAYAHQDLPFEHLVEVLHPQRSLSHPPLFQVLFAFQNAPMPPLHFADLHAQLQEVEWTSAQFDLTMTMEECGQELAGVIEYNADLFEAKTIQRLVERWQTLLSSIVADPLCSIDQLPLLGEQERRQILVKWNETELPFPTQLCVHQSFEHQTRQTPDAIAAVYEEQAISYRALDQHANQLAHLLRSLGVGPEVCVAICLERSLDVAVALLATLKSGGSYLPLDPAYPAERLTFMLQDSQALVLLTHSELSQRLPLPNAGHVICLDNAWECIRGQESTPVTSGVMSDHAAYLIYTSGSTGKPKGALVSHRAVVSYTLDIIKRFQLQSADRLLQFAPLSFDVTVEEFFPTWLSGGTLVLCQQKDIAEPAHFLDLILRLQLTAFELPTPYWHEWVRELVSSGDSLPDFLHLVIIGGERALPERLIAWKSLGARLVNVYGITEVTVTSTVYEPSPNFSEVTPQFDLPIGRPIANTQIYILDPHLQPVPIGVAGEIYIGGEHLARGYHNRPELTAERFLPNPFATTPGTRLYKTGDAARYRFDGHIEFLGRLDQQVKLRGFRIEPGEIEAALSRYPGLQDVVTAIREDTPGDKRLVAYCVADTKSLITSSDLRHFLRTLLPEYMIPSGFVFLDALPLTPSGKLDRRKLPVPAWDTLGEKALFTAPRTPVEEVLAGLWAYLLRLEHVGIHDNFFELGGHSLLVARLATQIRTILHVDVPLRLLFEASTVAEQANEIERITRTRQRLVIPPITPVLRTQSLPLSFAQQRLWFLYQLAPTSTSYTAPEAFRVQGKLDTAALANSLTEIVRRHEVLRTTFGLVKGEPVQFVMPPEPLPLPVIDLTALPRHVREAEALQLVDEESRRIFSLSTGPLIHTMLLRLAHDEHIFTLTMHHIAYDAWSMDILHRELTSLYSTFSKGMPGQLAELPIQYADFALWQRQWLQGETLQALTDYWREQLADMPTLQLPVDHLNPVKQTRRGVIESLQFPAPFQQGLKALSQQEGATLFMTLLTAFMLLLHTYTGQEDIAVGTDVANRSQPEVEPLIGFFINQVVLRANLSGNPTFRQLLGRVREVTLNAYTHQDLPFEKVVEVLNPERDLSGMPLVRAKFDYQIAAGPAIDHADLHLTELDVYGGMAKVDLLMNIEEIEQTLLCTLEYVTDLFEPATISQMLACYKALLAEISTDPDLPLTAYADSINRLRKSIYQEEIKKLGDANLQKLKNMKKRR